MPLTRRQLLVGGLLLPVSLGLPLPGEQHIAAAESSQSDGEDVVFAHISDVHMHGSSDEAEKALREALKINPNHIKALNNLAYLLAVTRNRPADALPFAERADRLAPNVPQVLDTLGYVYTLLGRNKEALPLLEKAATLLPDNPDVKDHLSRTKAALAP